MKKLLEEVRRCTVCKEYLEPNPVLDISTGSKIIIIGQAPGRIVHETKIAWNDKSGDNLRNWLGVDRNTFYNTDIFGIMPMGFCYPGKGKSGDLPPRPECAPLWHAKLFAQVKDVELILLIGQYAQHYYLQETVKENLTETVKNYKEYLPKFLPLPHPSPRNNLWIAKNKWFETDVLPELKRRVAVAIL